jgi:hypothetical protein
VTGRGTSGYNHVSEPQLLLIADDAHCRDRRKAVVVVTLRVVGSKAPGTQAFRPTQAGDNRGASIARESGKPAGMVAMGLGAQNILDVSRAKSKPRHIREDCWSGLRQRSIDQDQSLARIDQRHAETVKTHKISIAKNARWSAGCEPFRSHFCGDRTGQRVCLILRGRCARD